MNDNKNSVYHDHIHKNPDNDNVNNNNDDNDVEHLNHNVNKTENYNFFDDQHDADDDTPADVADNYSKEGKEEELGRLIVKPKICISDGLARRRSDH